MNTTETPSAREGISLAFLYERQSLQPAKSCIYSICSRYGRKVKKLIEFCNIQLTEVALNKLQLTEIL